MDATPVARRHFLSALAASAVGLPLAQRLEALAPGAAHTPARPRIAADRGTDRATWRRLAEEDYLLSPDIVYLNHASIGTVPRPVVEAHAAYLRLCEENPWLYMWGGAWEAGREDVRAAAAALLGTSPERVAITHNTTEGFNLLASGLPLGPGDEVLFSTLNHGGASVCFERQAARRGFRVRRFEIPLSDSAELDAAELLVRHLEAIGPDTRLLVLPHLDNHFGGRVPLADVVRGAKSRGVRWVVADGAQTAGMFDVDLDASGVDAYAMSPHKWIQAPKGLGLLHLHPDVQEILEPMWTTWGQTSWSGTVRRFEDYGTRNLPAVLALGDALGFHASIDRTARETRHRALHAHLQDRVSTSPVLRWRSPSEWDQGGALVAVEVVGAQAGAVAQRTMAAGGLIVRAFPGEGANFVRLSPNVHTTEDELDRALTLLEEAAP